MPDLTKLELAIRRLHAKREERFKLGQGPLNIDVQELLQELADELHRMDVDRK